MVVLENERRNAMVARSDRLYKPGCGRRRLLQVLANLVVLRDKGRHDLAKEKQYRPAPGHQ